MRKVRPGTDFVGDGFDSEYLLTAAELAQRLRVPLKSVYCLPIPRVRIGHRRIRWRPSDVDAFVRKRMEIG